MSNTISTGPLFSPTPPIVVSSRKEALYSVWTLMWDTWGKGGKLCWLQTIQTDRQTIEKDATYPQNSQTDRQAGRQRKSKFLYSNLTFDVEALLQFFANYFWNIFVLNFWDDNLNKFYTPKFGVNRIKIYVTSYSHL